jgi:hypothetical protein
MTSTTNAKVVHEKTETSLEGSAYEIIRGRLQTQSQALGEKVATLNARRLALFGTTEMAVLANERVRTENNCIPIDIVNVNGMMLFGYNVFVGLRKETRVADVFSLHEFVAREDGTFSMDALVAHGEGAHPATAFLRDPQFTKDFQEIFKYYKEAHLQQLRLTDTGRLLAVFQTGTTDRDVKVLRWSVEPAGVRYLDARGLEDHRFPATHSFEWTRTTRENHVLGRYPHVNILDELFVETVGGDLTVKIENNTMTGRGIYSEPVEDKNQSLDDAQLFFARVGTLILLRVLPFRETTWRHLVFNTRTKTVVRIDAIAASCVELPDEHGIIFPGGYALSTGEVKTYDLDGIHGAVFTRVVRADNGEDLLYVFFEAKSGHRVLLPYNLIDKEVRTPIVAHGWTLFSDGRLVAFRAESDEPVRLHPMRIWQTPFCSPEESLRRRASSAHQGSLLWKTGNAEAVSAISDLHTLRRLVANGSPTQRVYEDLIDELGRVIDAYPWLSDPIEALDIKGALVELRATAELVIDEFEKVAALQKAAATALALAEEHQRALFNDIRLDSFTSIDPFVALMTRLRAQRGALITLKDERYIDTARLELLEKQCAARFVEVTHRAGRFLQEPSALSPYQVKHDEVMKRGAEVTRAADLAPLLEELVAASSGLQLLTEVTGQLKIDDANARTTILEAIAAMHGMLNRARAVLDQKKKSLLAKEGGSEFAAQMRLLASAVESALSLCDSPERCDQELGRLLVTLEELEGRFAEFDGFVEQLTKKREEVFETLSARKQQLLDERNRRAQSLLTSAERILEGVKRRALSMKTVEELHAAFAADPMIDKVRTLSAELAALGDKMKAEEVLARLKAAREDATRVLRDRADIYRDGGDIIQLGQHRFAVNKQPFELTMLVRDGNNQEPELVLHVTGTEYFEGVQDEILSSLRDLWRATLVSEDDRVARVEYLAGTILLDAIDAKEGVASLEMLSAAAQGDGGLLALVADVARSRYDEGYERGVHDADAARILEALLTLRRQAGRLAHAPNARACAALFWAQVHESDRLSTTARVRGAARLAQRFPAAASTRDQVNLIASELLASLPSLLPHDVRLNESDAYEAAWALLAEVGPGPGDPEFVLSSDAQALVDDVFATLDKAAERSAFEAEHAQLSSQPVRRLALALAWVRAVIDVAPAGSVVARAAPAALEAAVELVTRGRLRRVPSGAMSSVVLEGMLSQHRRIVDRRLEVRLDELLPRVRRFADERVPRFLRMKERRAALVEDRRRSLRIAEFQPRVLASFVRNRLINEVYLPIVGNNLAKQMGAAGDKKRADLMGLLLLVSPPGYGKTTLIEYVAQRLGLFYVKVNGPSLGHPVTSLDPAEAPDATSRQEVEKLNFAFELGNNVLLLIDDIQHTSAELLQKFISLCDGTRRIEGVWRGRARTYDLRGKRFVICMAGNPYTETGEKFRIPDMLANRADTYNLGDISGGRGDVFGLSFLENALTAHPTTQPLAARDPADVHLLLRLAQGESVAITDLKHAYGSAEVDELVRIFEKLLKIQKVLLQVNAAYVGSAATDDRFRTEPPFKLQGSYRNMAKLAQGVVAVMNEEELEQLIDDHYKSESQTLRTGAEANLLKLAELRGRLTVEQAARWSEIKRNFERIQLQGDSNDPATRVAGTLASLTQRIDDISTSITTAAATAAGMSRESSAHLQVRLEQTLAEQGRNQATHSTQARLALAQASEAIVDSLHSLGHTMSANVATALVRALSDRLTTGLARDMSRELSDGLSERLTSTLGVFLADAWGAAVREGADSLGDALASKLQAQAQSYLQEQRTLFRESEEGANARAQQHQQVAAVPRHDVLVAKTLEQVAGTVATTLATVAENAQVRVQIDTPAPPGMAELLRAQTEIIASTLLPLVRALPGTIQEQREQASRLEAALASLRALEQKGIATGTSTTETQRPLRPRPQGTRVKE